MTSQYPTTVMRQDPDAFLQVNVKSKIDGNKIIKIIIKVYLLKTFHNNEQNST